MCPIFGLKSMSNLSDGLLETFEHRERDSVNAFARQKKPVIPFIGQLDEVHPFDPGHAPGKVGGTSAGNVLNVRRAANL